MAKAPRTLPEYTQTDNDRYLQGRRDALAELRASGGVARSVFALQVLFCLPDSFVVSYEALWDRATSGDLGAVAGRGVEQDKGSGRASGQTGMVLGSETRLQAGGGGKKYKKPTDTLGSSAALALKTAVDKELVDLAGRISRELGAKGAGNQATGRTGSSGARSGNVTPKCGNPGCGRFVKADWRFCPKCGWERG